MINNENEKYTTEKRAKEAIKLGIGVAIVGLVLAIGAAVMTQKTFGQQDDTNALFARLGQIGDVLGGATGPVFNIVGMLVVYYSLREQLRANNDQNIAIANEFKRANDEDLLNSTKEVIEATKSEIKLQDLNIKNCLERIRTFEDDIETNRALEYAESEEEKIRARLASLDDELAELVGLLTLAQNRVFNPNFPAAYKFYIVTRFYRECIDLLMPYMKIQRVVTMILPEDIGNIDRIISIKNDSLRDKYDAYRKAWDLSNNL